MNAAYIKPIIYFCNKILPAVYDESLSYYEALCKMRDKLNEVIDNVNNVNQHIDDVINQRLTDEHLLELFRVFVVDIEAAICANNEGSNTNSSKDYKVNQMLWLNDKLYKVIRDIDAGDTFIVDTNIELSNFEAEYNAFITKVNEFLSEYKSTFSTNDEFDNIISSKDYTIGEWLWYDNELYMVVKDIAEGTGFIFTGENKNLERITVEERVTNYYFPEEEKLVIHGVRKGSSVVTRGDYHIYDAPRQTIRILHLDENS